MITALSGPSEVTFSVSVTDAVGALLRMVTSAVSEMLLRAAPSPAFTCTVQTSPFKVDEAGSVVRPVNDDFIVPSRHHVISEFDCASPSISDIVN